MWQNKIQILWNSIKSAEPKSFVCDSKSYSNLIQDLNSLNQLLTDKSKLKIAVVMEKSYYSLLSITFCLLKGHCFLPVYYRSKNLNSTLQQFNADLIFSLKNLSIDSKREIVYVDQISENAKSHPPIKPAKLNPNSVAYVISTSGTTGLPKLIPISYKNFNAYLTHLFPQIESKSPFRLIQNFEITFDPYLFDLANILFNQSHLLPVSNENLRHIEKIFDQNRTQDTWITLTPTQADLILSLMNQTQAPQVKRTYFLGEKLKTELCLNWLKTFPNSEIYNMYGPAETTVSIFTHKFNKEKDKNLYVPIGRIHDEHEFKIENKNELMINGPQVFSGYLELGSLSNNPADWFNTKDIVEIQDSNLFITGRSDLQIKINGRRFQPEELEVALSKHGISGYAIVISSETQHTIKNYIAFVSTDKSIELSNLREKIKDQFDVDFLPKQILVVKEYPHTFNGKIDRAKLASMIKEMDL